LSNADSDYQSKKKPQLCDEDKANQLAKSKRQVLDYSGQGTNALASVADARQQSRNLKTVPIINQPSQMRHNRKVNRRYLPRMRFALRY
jgi:hypothetical protein